MAIAREILDRRDYRWFEMKIADAYDLGPPAAFPSDVLVREPGWTLHEFDFDRAEAVFLDVGASTNLFEPAFSYLAAFRASRRFATLPIDEFLALTAALPLPRRLSTSSIPATAARRWFTRSSTPAARPGASRSRRLPGNFPYAEARFPKIVALL